MHAEQAISLNGHLWIPGQTIGVGFLDGSPIQRAKVQRWFEYLLQVVNLHLDFNATHPDARITFAPGPSWSYIGTDCRSVLVGPTMQFGWVTDTSDDISDRAVIGHEGLHFFGAGHEQANPLTDLKIDVPKARAYFMETQGWNEQMFQDNVLHVYSPSEVTGTAYDRLSLMQYFFPDALTLDGRGIPPNTDLSLLDRSYWGTTYPGVWVPPPPPQPPPPLPPVPPPLPTYPAITIGARAAHSPVPAPGQPARFSLTVDRQMTLNLAVAVEPSFGGVPLTMLEWPGGSTKLGLHAGKVTYRFAAGAYVVNVYNPRPRQTGTVYVRARHAVG